MWSLVVDLFKKLHEEEFNNQGRTIDLVIVIKGKRDKILTNLMQITPNFVGN